MRTHHLVALVLAIAVIAASMLLNGDTQQVTLLGEPVPTLCLFRRLTGFRCPGCGLTRSFVFMGHAHPFDALRTHVFGPALWIFVAAQIPYRILQLKRLSGRSAAGLGNAGAGAVSE